MYVELLSAALAADQRGPMTSEDVRASAIDCRARMLGSRSRTDRSAVSELASEVDYDRSLINLCKVLGIDSGPERFAQPGPERTRLEGALAQEGEDLTTDGSADITDQTS